MKKGNVKLIHLMEILNLTGSQLALYLNIDRTIVSKWRSNARPLTVKSSHYTSLISSLIKINKDQKAKTLERFFDKIYPNTDKNEPSYLETCIIMWLIEERASELIKESEHQINTNALYSAQIDIYQGNDGRRKAVDAVMDYCMALPPGQEIYLSEMEEMSWLFEDLNYASTCWMKLGNLLKLGHNITVVHNTSRQTKIIDELLKTWLPLYLTGNLTSYYSDDLELNGSQPSILMIHNHIAMQSTNNSSNTRNRHIVVYRDPQSIKNSYNTFISRLKLSKKLVSTYNTKGLSLKGFMMQLTMNQSDHNNVYSVSSFPLMVTLEKTTLLKILRENNIDEATIEIVCDTYDKTKASLFQDIETHFYRQHYNLTELERNISSNSIISSELSAYANQEIKLSPELFREHLLSTIKILEKYDNFNIALFPFDEYSLYSNASIYVKNSSIIYTLPQVTHKSIMISDQSFAVNGFFNQYEKIWNSLDEEMKDKSIIITKLKNIVKCK